MRGYAKDNPFERERKMLGKKIVHMRQQRRFSQEMLAEKTHINVSYLAKIENGYVNTTLRYLIKISRGLQVSVHDLIEF